MLFVMRRRFDEMRDEYDSQVWYWKKRCGELEQNMNDLQKKNRALQDDNARLVKQRELLFAADRASERAIKDLRLKIMSLEARWPVKSDTGGDDQ